VRLDPAPALAAGTGGARFLARGQGHPFRQFSERRRRAALRLLEAGLEAHPETAGLLKALLLGSRLHLPPDLRQDFMTTGTFHVIAISGLHVGMIAWLLATLLRFGGLSRVWWFPVLAPLLILYTAATGASASAMRACIMALLFVAAPLIGRRPDAGSAWAAAALLIVGLAPFQIQDRGFLLSFTLVGGLLLLAPLTARSLPAFLKPDPFQAPELVPAWKRAAAAARPPPGCAPPRSAGPGRAPRPRTAQLLGNRGPGARLAIVLGALWLPLAVLANTLNLGIITALLKILGWLAAIPGACVAVPRPPWWILPLWYAGLVVAAVSLRSRPKPEEPSFG
jgi:competence protein ComEC